MIIKRHDNFLFMTEIKKKKKEKGKYNRVIPAQVSAQAFCKSVLCWLNFFDEKHEKLEG